MHAREGFVSLRVLHAREGCARAVRQGSGLVGPPPPPRCRSQRELPCRLRIRFPAQQLLFRQAFKQRANSQRMFAECPLWPRADNRAGRCRQGTLKTLMEDRTCSLEAVQHSNLPCSGVSNFPWTAEATDALCMSSILLHSCILTTQPFFSKELS